MKKCQICGKRASMFLTQIVNGKASELALCEDCAKAKGLFDPQSLAFAEKFFPEEFRKRVDKLVEELGISLGGQPEEAGSPKRVQEAAPGADLLTQCPVCGFTLEDYRRTGRLGCPDCYEVFTKEIHGDTATESGEAQPEPAVTLGSGTATTPDDRATEHRSPAVLKGKLQKQLEKAVEKEDYEEAARLRDRIRSLENEGNE